MNYSDLLTNLHLAQCVRGCVCVCVCVCLGGRGGVFMRALLWHMRVQSCLITDQALRQRQTVL